MAEGVSACSPPRSIPPHARNVDLLRRMISRDYVNYNFHTPYLQDRYSKVEESSPKVLGRQIRKIRPGSNVFFMRRIESFDSGHASSTFESIKFGWPQLTNSTSSVA